jgi:PAS domain S-box-containing protein
MMPAPVSPPLPWHVVVVDDSPDDRAEVRRLLTTGSDRRYRWTEAETGAGAVRAVRDSPDGPPDCVVLDFSLPDMTAVAVLGELAGPDGLPSCPVVVLTGRAGQDDHRAVFRAGAQDYLGKGWMTAESLVRAVENARERWAAAHERRAGAAAVRASEDRLKEAQRLARLGSWTWEPPPGRVWWSDALCDLLGVDRTTATPSFEAFLALVHPADRPLAVRRVEAVLGGADGFADDIRLVTPDGRLIWIHSRARATRTPDGRLVRVEGTDQDITSRKLAEAALAASDERFRLAAAAARAMVYDLDVPTRRINSLHGVTYLVGYSESEIERTLDWWDGRIHPADLPACRAAFQRLGAAPREQTLHYRVRAEDGRTLWVEDRVAPVCDEAGALVRLVGTVVDVTERKQAEDLLRRNHETFYHLVQNNPFGVYVVDADFRLRQVSLGARKVFQSISPLLDRDFEEVIHALWPEPFAGQVIARFRSTLATGEPYAAPRTIERRRDIGEVEAYDWRIERVTLPDGRFGVVCYFYDLSERQRWEAALVAKERELRSLADNSPDILSRFDRALRHVFVNAAVERATGRPAADFLGRTNRELGMPPDLCDRWEAALRLAFERQTPAAIEFAFDAPDGVRHFTARLVPEPAPDGSVEFVLSVAHDVTDR